LKETFYPLRLMYHSHVINIHGQTYRLKDKRQAGMLTWKGAGTQTEG